MKKLKRILLIFCVVLTVFTSLFPFRLKASAVQYNQAVYYDGFDVGNLDLSKMPTDWYEFTKTDYCGTMIEVKSATQLSVTCFDMRTWAPSVRQSDGALVLVRFNTSNGPDFYATWMYSSTGSLHASTNGRSAYVTGNYTWSKDSDSYICSTWSESVGTLSSFWVSPPSDVSDTTQRKLEYSYGTVIAASAASDVYLKGSVILLNSDNEEITFSQKYTVGMPCDNFAYSTWGEGKSIGWDSFPDDSKKYRTRTLYGIGSGGAHQLTIWSNSINSENKWVARELSNFPTFESQDANTQKGILAAVKAIPEKIGSFFSELANSIGNFFSQLGDRISGFFTELTNKLQGFFTELTNKLSGFFTTLKNYLLWFNAEGEASYTNPFSDLLTDLKKR